MLKPAEFQHGCESEQYVNDSKREGSGVVRPSGINLKEAYVFVQWGKSNGLEAVVGSEDTTNLLSLYMVRK